MIRGESYAADSSVRRGSHVGPDERVRDVLCGKVEVPRLVGQEDQRKKQRTKPDRSKRLRALWAHGCLEGRQRVRAILVQHRCQWSAAKAGVTSALSLHDATHAYLSMKHDVAKQAGSEMALKEVDKFFFFDQRISLVVATKIDIMARSSIWLGDFCVPRIFVKATCSAFQTEKKVLEKTGKMPALHVECCPITGQSTSLGTTGYVDDFSCYLLGVRAASCPHASLERCQWERIVRSSIHRRNSEERGRSTSALHEKSKVKQKSPKRKLCAKEHYEKKDSQKSITVAIVTENIRNHRSIREHVG